MAENNAGDDAGQYPTPDISTNYPVNLPPPFTPPEVVMTITVTLMEETDDDIDLDSRLFIDPRCDPATYAPAFIKVLTTFTEQFKQTEKKINAPKN